MMRKRFIVLALVCALLMIAIGMELAQADGPTPKEQLGKALFFDTNLSQPPGQSCAVCHGPDVGFTGPDANINNTTVVYPGAIFHRFGNRKPPSSAYGGDSPVLYYDEVDEVWVGGMFWDGRASGWTLGDPLAEQAQGPYLNPLEQNVPHAKQVCIKVRNSSYAGLFEQAWGPGSLDCNNNLAATYDYIGLSVAAYERSDEVNPFSSKYDCVLAGSATLSAQEEFGLEVFNGKGLCSACHLSDGPKPLFTDFTYDNLGIPKNPDNPFYAMNKQFNPDGYNWIDPGLGGFLKAAEIAGYEDEWGKHKVPSLRNVDLRPYEGFVKAYGHNGYFKSLEAITHFYNTRDVASENWPAPEVPGTVNTDELGNLGLTADEEAAIVAFMKTLSDGFACPAP